MPTIATLQDLLVHQLRDIYSAEKQLVAALPKMAKKSTAVELKDAMTTHLGQTKGQMSRLEEVFEQLGVSGRGPKCKAMEGLIAEANEMFEEDIENGVLDAGIIASAQRVEHYEIAAYGTVIEFARALGHSEVVQLLQQTLAEERETSDGLTTLAESGVTALVEHQADSVADDEDVSSDDESEDELEKAPMPSRGKKAAPKRTA